MADVRNESFSVSPPSMCKVSPPCSRLAFGLAAVLERGQSLAISSPGIQHGWEGEG